MTNYLYFFKKLTNYICGDGGPKFVYTGPWACDGLNRWVLNSNPYP